jgi:hypothetical protein
MQKLLLALVAGSASAFVAPLAKPAPATAVAESKADLKELATSLNPVVGYWDPLGCFAEDTDLSYWSQGNEATIAWFRHAEIKHGRVAMFGFVGYLVHATGKTWPFPMTLSGDPWPKLGEGGVPALWDALPEISKWQIILFVGALEFWSEIQGVGDGEPHYMRGGKVGGMRSFKSLKLGIPDLYDPTGGLRNASEEKKARGRLVEINNGRLAMIGLFGFLAEAKVPGSVPALTKIGIPAYAGDVMAPFESNFHILS